MEEYTISRKKVKTETSGGKRKEEKRRKQREVVDAREENNNCVGYTRAAIFNLFHLMTHVN